MMLFLTKIFPGLIAVLLLKSSNLKTSPEPMLRYRGRFIILFKLWINRIIREIINHRQHPKPMIREPFQNCTVGCCLQLLI